MFGTELGKARLRSTFWAGLDLIPNAMIGVLLLLGALAVGRHELTLGGLVAFITLTLQLVWPIESMGYILAGGQEAATAAQRIYEILDTEPAITSPARRTAARGRPPEPPRSPLRAEAGPPSPLRRSAPGAASSAGLRPGRVPLPGGGARLAARRLADR